MGSRQTLLTAKIMKPVSFVFKRSLVFGKIVFNSENSLQRKWLANVKHLYIKMLCKLSLSRSAQKNFPFIRCTVLPFESSLYKLLTDHFPLCFPVHLPHYVLILFSPPLFLIRGECGDSNCEVWHDLCKLVCLSKLEMRHKEVRQSWIELTVNHGSKKSLFIEI